jgi:hypothetical protein
MESGIDIDLNPKAPAIPRVADKTKIDVRYMVIAPYVSIHVYYDAKSGEVIYEVEEPILSEDEEKNRDRVEQAMREIVNVNLLKSERTKEALIDYVDKTARLIISELGLKVGKGTVIIDMDADSISWVIDSSFEYSEEGEVVPIGSLDVLTTASSPWKVTLTEDYGVDIQHDGQITGTKELSSASVPYKIIIENSGRNGGGNMVININVA